MPQLFVVGYAQDHSRFVMDLWHIPWFLLVPHVIGSSHSYFAILGKAMIRWRPQVYMDKDKGIVDTGTWNIMLHAYRDTHDVIHPMDVSFVFHFSWGSLSSQLHEFYSKTRHAWAFWAVHPSIYRPVPPWCTMTARSPPASPRSLPCSSPLKCLHESEALARNVGKSSLPNPTSNDRISHCFCWGLKSSHFFVALLKTCRIGMCHWRLFFSLDGGGPYLSSQNAMNPDVDIISKKKHIFFEVPPCLQWFKVDMTDI